MAVLEIKGDIIPNEDKWRYDWMGWDATCPADADKAIMAMQPGEKLEVIINSNGGSVFAGQEIYSKLKRRDDVTIEIQSVAASAASIVAMAGKSKISPVGIIMIHNVSMSGASGDYHDMQKNAEILKQMNSALARAYTEKTGMSLEEALKLMDRETWLRADECLKYGFIDEIMTEQQTFVNSVQNMRMTDEIRRKIDNEKAQRDKEETLKSELLKDLDMYSV